ncbi:hypothetical protein A0U40_15470 [[Bacillus] sp. KCTC 13219]|nr:hypothetical protein A0U40_15470 [[Bacillus] sp. KCTC 13219]
MIRQAVGAIIFHQAEILLVHKVKISTIRDMQIQGEWDFPKGGIEHNDKNLEAALFRELIEETGSVKYKVLEQLDEKIIFHFAEEFTHKTGYKMQETTMFVIEYTGDRSDLMPQDNEIRAIEFFSPNETLAKLTHQDTKLFFEKALKTLTI